MTTDASFQLLRTNLVHNCILSKSPAEDFQIPELSLPMNNQRSWRHSSEDLGVPGSNPAKKQTQNTLTAVAYTALSELHLGL